MAVSYTHLDVYKRQFKNIAIDHNIRLMHKLSRELTFGDVLEAARSTRNWKDTRAYLNIFAEYFTYMNQRQKQMAMNFLYDLMFHREGDIRRQAADLLGNMICLLYTSRRSSCQ